jgi:small subunit ribosomal protein S8
MVSNDLVSDFLTRIRNALIKNEKNVIVVKSRMIMSILEILKEKGKIEGFAVVDDRSIEVFLRYSQGRPVIKELKKVSKPGIRKYVKVKDIKPVYNGFGVALISTPKGVMSGEEAIKQGVGGEYICYVF